MKVIDKQHQKRKDIQAFMDKAEAQAEARSNEHGYTDQAYAFRHGYTLSYVCGALNRLNLTKAQMAILTDYE